jgi:hypothetical protein
MTWCLVLGCGAQTLLVGCSTHSLRGLRYPFPGRLRYPFHGDLVGHRALPGA